MNFIVFIFVLLILMLAFDYTIQRANYANYVAPYGSSSQKQWWKKEGWKRFGYPYYSFWSEGFENIKDRPANVDLEGVGSLLKDQKEKESSVLAYPPDSPGPANLYNNTPYHLLGDEMSPPRVKESISCVNSRSCYATDFERMISKTGNYRQMTNNYKRGYPDSCSAPYQELVLNFYKADSMPIPPNNTGGSVSEVGYGLN
jgi:hypothetical protein